MAHEPTDEQAAAVEIFETGLGLAIEALAGTGKTTTLRMLGASTTRRGQYAAFNRAIVDDARGSSPRNVACHTAHSLAMRAEGRAYQHRLDSKRMRSYEIAKALGITGQLWLDTIYGGRKPLSASYLASTVMRAITEFCFTADDEPGPQHVPFIDGIDPPVGLAPNNEKVAEHLRPYLAKAWADIQDTAGCLTFSHDHYLKLWERRDPKILGDFVLFDEAQDASPVMISIVEQQEGKQQVWVGDENQQIYGWRGSVNAMASCKAEARTRLSQSFRFGSEIASVANKVLAKIGTDARLRGLPSIDSVLMSIGDPDAILCRSNAGAVTEVMAYLRADVPVHLVGGGGEIASFARAALELQAGVAVEHRDLACFDSWATVQAYTSDDPQGSELRLLVSLVDEFGAAEIIDAMENMADEVDAEVVVSTAHKAKGREWNTVRISDDFATPGDGAVEEWRLLYVAVTRARFGLDVTMCEPLRTVALANRLSAAW